MSRISGRWGRRAMGMLLPVGAGLLLWSQVGTGLPFDPPVRLVASLSNRTLKVVEDGDVVRTYGIAIGRSRYPTPTGSFRTGAIDWNPRWVPPPSRWARNKKPRGPGDPANPMQGVKIPFKPPYYYIHGTNNPESIGEAASHGCIRMTADDAIELARRIQRAGGSVPLRILH